MKIYLIFRESENGVVFCGAFDNKELAEKENTNWNEIEKYISLIQEVTINQTTYTTISRF